MVKLMKQIKGKRKKIYILIYIFLTLLIIFATVYILEYFLLKKEAIEESKLLNTIDVDESKITENETERMLQVKDLQMENPDIVGWIEIENTSINYPVLQGTDNEYYLSHNYKKEKSKKGSIILSKDYDWNLSSNNLLIYGHNVKNGEMFQDLLKYQDEEFYKDHPIIRFTTEKKDVEYEIISVFKSMVYYKSEKDVFKYYNFINPETEKEYNEFVENVKNLSLYNIDETAQYGEQLITLSTCSYHTEDGRFVVVGKEKENQ